MTSAMTFSDSNLFGIVTHILRKIFNFSSIGQSCQLNLLTFLCSFIEWQWSDTASRLVFTLPVKNLMSYREIKAKTVQSGENFMPYILKEMWLWQFSCLLHPYHQYASSGRRNLLKFRDGKSEATCCSLLTGEVWRIFTNSEWELCVSFALS